MQQNVLSANDKETIFSVGVENNEKIVYKPRLDREVFEELKNKGLPIELKEQLQIIDSCPTGIQQKIDAIIKRIFAKNNLNDTISYPDIQISGNEQENAAMIAVAKQPILILTKGILKNVQSEDELAGVIAHELGHLVLHAKQRNGNNQGKAAETAADNWGVDLLYKAGYDPHGVIFFLQRAGGGETHLIDVESITDADSLKKKEDLVRTLLDPHPSEESRIRTMEIYITSLKRNGDMIQIPQTTALESKFTEEIDEISYESPLAQGLKKVSYESMSIVEKLTVLTQLLDDVYPPTNRTAAERMQEIASYIEPLSVDFNDLTQAEAFKCLADVAMRPKVAKGVIVFPKSSRLGDRLDDILNVPLTNVWRRGLKDPHYLARNEDLKEALELFTDAQTKEDAEKKASEIIALCKKIDFHSRSNNFKGFYPPSIEEIKRSIYSVGQWRPPYSQHVIWCREENSENIKKVLRGMKLAKDPWAAKTIGSQIDFLEEYQYGLNIANFNVKAFFCENETLFNQFTRTDEGIATDSLVEELPYPWHYFSPDSSLESLKAFHTQEAEKKHQYEENIVNSTDWQFLKTNFPRFIARYGKLIQHHFSIVPISSPFAERFFAELSAFLPLADEEFKAQAQDFFRHWSLDDPTPSHPTAIRHFYELYPPENSEWIYKNVSRPYYWTFNHPFIKFVLNPLSSKVISDNNKIYYLKGVPGFINPDSQKKLREIFLIPLDSLCGNYPKNIKTVADLEAMAKKKTEYHESIIIALEAERLAYELQETMTLEDFVSLDKLRAVDEEIYSCNLESFFKELKHKTIQRHLDSTDCNALIKSYQYIVAHHLLDGAPNIRNAAHNKIKALFPTLTFDNKLQCLKELLYTKVFKPMDISSLELGKKYHGYIADPEMRNWVIEQLTDALAAQLGSDDGSTEYKERIRPIIKELSTETVGLTQLNLLSSLATKVNAQKEVAYLIRDTYTNHALSEALTKYYEGIAIELLINESSRDPQLRQHILDYLAKPLTQTSHCSLRNYMVYKYEFKLSQTSIETIDEQLQNYHKNFHTASLEFKTASLEPLLFPLSSTECEQLDIIQKLIHDILPTQEPNANPHHAHAQLIAKSYLETADLAERRLLATSLFIANIQEEDTVERTMGQKLNLVLSHMGPAGGKLLQAIHSHPQTPEDLKRDLSSAKTRFDPPLRWELVEYIDQSGLLKAHADNPYPVVHIGPLVGSGSFGLTVFNTLSDKTQVADTFLRKNAAQKAEREFEMMHRTAKKIVATNPELQPVIYMVDEAKRAAREETNMKLAEQANLKAIQSYHHVRVLVGEYEFTHEVTQLQKTGDNYKRVTIAQGEHFNDLKSSSYKTALAKAMIVTQLSLRLAGCNTDLDRHGGNIKVKGTTITHFDFGAMNLSPITQEDKRITGKILAQILIAVNQGEEFSKALLTTIQNAQVSQASRIYLNGLNKDFLALGDYLHEIDKEELSHLVAQCLIANTVDPQINAAFKEELGLFSYGLLCSGVLINNLQSKVQGTEIEVLFNGNLVKSEQTKDGSKNKMLGSFFSHQKEKEVISPSIEENRKYSLN